jgi:hypothetical protein
MIASLAPATVFAVTDAQAARKASHNNTNARIKKILWITLSTFLGDRLGISSEDDTEDLFMAASEIKSAGEENERLGPGELGGGGKRNLVDHVFTRFSDPSWREADEYLSARNAGGSDVGVEGGVRAEANTSNWRER